MTRACRDTEKERTNVRRLPHSKTPSQHAYAVQNQILWVKPLNYADHEREKERRYINLTSDVSPLWLPTASIAFTTS
jgi:hypothetical protein